MDKVRIGVVGIGKMGSYHAKYIDSGEIKNAELTAICDTSDDCLKWASNNLKKEVVQYKDYKKLFESGTIDGVLIAVPHYEHSVIAIEAFKNGLHVLTEKPAGVYTKQVREMNEAAEKSGKIFGIMYNQRTNPLYQKLREIIQSGELGEIKRTNWIVTDWYRPQVYYDTGDWRATWVGEGGGVLINQCPHNLDLWQWICGMPVKVRAFCGLGKYHDIEVEDDVTAYVEYENGATGVFITSTAEAPGTNRFEVSGDMGKLVVEDGKLTFWRNRQSEREFNCNSTNPFSQPETWKCEIPIKGVETSHKGITENWVCAITNGTSMLAPGIEGINGLSISNAIQLSSWTDNWVSLPIDEELYFKNLKKKIDSSKPKTKTGIKSDLDGNITF